MRIISVRCIPLSLRFKTRRRATPLFPTWIYSCRSGGREEGGGGVSCALPFTTNVTISTSISCTFRSREAIVYLRQSIAFYLSTHGISEMAPVMNVLFRGMRDFYISFSNKVQVENTSYVSPACRKRRLNGAMCRSYRKKGWSRVGIWMGTLKNPAKCL